MSRGQPNGSASDSGMRTERALRASELSYRRLFEAAQDGILILDADTGRINDVNPFLTKLLGFSHGEMVGKTVGELSPFKDIVSNQTILEQLQTDGYVRYEDLPLETKDRRKIAVEFVSNVYQAGDKKVIQCNIRDITARKQAEGVLRESQQILEGIINAIPVRVFWKNKSLVYLGCNSAFARDAGFADAKDIIGKDDFQMQWSEQAEKYRGDDLQVIASGRPRLLLEEPQTTPGGQTITLLTSKSPMRCAKGEVNGVVGTYMDITERKRAEEALRLLGSAVEQSKESVMITDAELDLPGPRIVFVNPAFTQMTGHTAAEAMGKTPRLLQGARTDKAVLRQLREHLDRGEAFASETINYRKDGTEINLEWHIAPLRNASGTITHFVATQHDLTAHKKLEMQFRQAQKMDAIGQLAGGVAHDFNNILAVILIQCDMLKMEGRPTAAQLEYVEEIAAATQRAAALTRQLLLFSRKEMLQLRDLDLNRSINDMTKMLRRILGEDVQMTFKFAMQPLVIRADAGMMDQVLMNLAVNSRDAMPQGGMLIIETSAVDFDETVCAQSVHARAGSFVCLSVSDNGCGISAENLPRIFEPFFTTKEVGKGTGLGLATVFGIVQQHRGWVNVYSEVGQGTTFRIYLPRLASMSLQNPERPALPALRGGNETILLVEDDNFLRPSICKILSQLGYHVLAARSGVEALSIWNQHHDEIQLLLTDLVLPGCMTGKAVGERLLLQNPKLKVIYASGYSAEIVSKDFTMEEGVNFLTKPFPEFKLAQTIRRTLDAIS